MTSESSRSMAPSAPSAKSAGSPNADYGYADESLPPQGQQGQSWYQSAVRFVRDLFSMPEDLLASFAKAQKLHHGNPGYLWERSMKDQWQPWSESGRQKMAYKIYKEIAPKLLSADKNAEAGESYEALALLELKYYSNDDLVMMENDKHFEKAYKAYHDVLPLASARCIQQMINHRVGDGNLRSAAPYAGLLGDLYMTKCDDLEGAITAWQKAANWYKNDRAVITAVGYYKKIGEAYAKKRDYYKAIEAWDWCADNYPDSSASTTSTQKAEFFFNAGLCHVATADTVALSRAIQHYVNLESSFGRVPQYRFLVDISRVMENGDEERYIFLRDSFNDIHQLPTWKMNLLNEGLERMKAAGDDFS